MKNVFDDIWEGASEAAKYALQKGEDLVKKIKGDFSELDNEYEHLKEVYDDIKDGLADDKLEVVNGLKAVADELRKEAEDVEKLAEDAEDAVHGDSREAARTAATNLRAAGQALVTHYRKIHDETCSENDFGELEPFIRAYCVFQMKAIEIGQEAVEAGNEYLDALEEK